MPSTEFAMGYNLEVEFGMRTDVPVDADKAREVE